MSSKGKVKKQLKKSISNPPGSLVYRGKMRTEKVRVRIIRFSTEKYEETKFSGSPEELVQHPELTTWIHVNGIHDPRIIQVIGKEFGLHPLLMEDILHTETHPKLEEFRDHIFVSLNGMSFDSQSDTITASNVSLVLTKNALLSFQEAGDDYNSVLYERLAAGLGAIRSRKSDYLFYRCIDIIVDEYRDILEHVEDRTEQLEDVSINSSDNSLVMEIQKLRRQLIKMRRNVTPLKNTVSRLNIDSGEFIHEQTQPFIRDLLDHMENVHDRIESERENLLSIMDINYTNVSNKANEVMKVLTIVASVFIPMTFVAGIYGMNFDHMPELGWKYSYAVFWIVILVMILTMFTYFKSKKWL